MRGAPPKPSDCQKPLTGAPVIGFSDLLGRWRGGILNAPKNDDPWFDSEQKADEWAYDKSRKLHNNDVWAIWNPECAAVILYHEGLRYKSA